MRILVVEDEFLVALQITEDLQSAGYEVVGPFTSLADAMRATNSETFDVAVLDVNLNDERVYPLAHELQARGTPFILLSGYLAADLPANLKASLRLAKPHDREGLIEAIRRSVAEAD